MYFIIETIAQNLLLEAYNNERGVVVVPFKDLATYNEKQALDRLVRRGHLEFYYTSPSGEGYVNTLEGMKEAAKIEKLEGKGSSNDPT